MKINKSLKFADFSYDDEEKVFKITDKEGNTVTLNKVYSFAFMRFIIRIAQRNWLRQAPKKKKSLLSPQDPLADTAEFIFEENISEDSLISDASNPEWIFSK